jgi:hypothetical protein
MFVIYGYVAWVIVEYAWQWWKDRRQKDLPTDASTPTGDQQGHSCDRDVSTSSGA